VPARISLRVDGFGVSESFLCSPARLARNGVAGGCECRCARYHTRHRTVARAVELAGCSGARAKGASPERASERSERASERGRQTERARSAGETFYTLQAGLWRGDCGGNALHLHLICINNDDNHGGGGQAPRAQGTEIGVARVVDVGARIQGAQFAVADGAQPGAAQAGAHAVDHGPIQRVITALARRDIHGHRHAQRVEGGQHHLDLGQVGAVLCYGRTGTSRPP
jgi:hypothetical protein